MSYVILGIITLVLLLTVAFLMFRKYQKALENEGFFDNFFYKFSCETCEHPLKIKFTKDSWKLNFKLKKEKHISVRAAGFELTKYNTSHRFHCETCGQNRWFQATNSPSDIKAINIVRLKYLLFTFVFVIIILYVMFTILGILLST